MSESPSDPGGAPTILALDFDGVLCEGAREYFESSRRACGLIWSDAPLPDQALLGAFRELRAVIETGWEMPVLLKGLAAGIPASRIADDWKTTREAILAQGGRPRAELEQALRGALDAVRREWIAADRASWLAHHALYSGGDTLRRLLAAPGATFIVTTKEGEFAQELLAHWRFRVAGVYGKESGSHKCENLRQLAAAHRAAGGRSPTVWFVEDRLETLRCVTTHPDLADVGLYLATWGYNTARTRESVQGDGRVRALSLAEFDRGPAAWPR